MYFLVRVVLICTAVSFILSESGTASVIFRPGKKAKFVPPGEEEISGTALELYQTGQTAEKEGNLKRAIHAYKDIPRRYPKDALAASALYRAAQLQEQVHDYLGAADSYRQLVERYPSNPHFDEAIEAQYQIGYIELMAARKGSTDAAATTNAKTAFQDFLLHYPHSEKAAQARANLDLLEHKETTSSYQVAKFYDKQKYYRAAVIYYKDVIRQQPGSTESNLAKKRIDQLRAKVGEAALQPALPVAQTGKKKGEAHGTQTAATGSAKPGPANNEAPLPAPDRDGSLPPPASLGPDTTTAPDPPFAPPSTSTSSDISSTPAASASPAP